jgi:hypothetical protein
MTLVDLALLVAIIVGINFALLLAFSKRAHPSANRFLALALMVSVLWIARILAIDIGLVAIFPIWPWVPFRFSQGLGPLIYFYVLKITRPVSKLRLLRLNYEMTTIKMEILQKNLLTIRREKCSSGWDLDVFGDHIIVNAREEEDNFRSAYPTVKQEITRCVKAHFPERSTELLFEMRNGSWNGSFKIGKTISES